MTTARVTILTNGGEEWSAGRLAGTNTSEAKYVGWGTGTGTPAKTDTLLFTPATEDRVTGTASMEGSGSQAKFQVEGTITADADKAITNAGTFTALSSGTLVIHTAFDELLLNEDDQITFTFTLDPG